MEPVLEVRNLNSYYTVGNSIFGGRNKRHQVLKDVSFDLYEGEILGLVGESGSGKSTLAKAILGLITDIDGEIIHHSKRPQMVFQDPFGSLNPAHTIGWILEEPLRMEGKLTAAERRKAVVDMLEQVGLGEEYYDRKPDELSGGQRQRVAIAGAVITHPRFVIADEPVSALDVTIQAQILELINKIKKERNLSVIFITHNMGVVANMADRIAVMYAGKIVEYGTAEEVFYEPAHPYTWALLSSMPDLETTERLESIPGTPPNMIYPPKGDAFAARNKFALEIDFELEPPLFEVTPTHFAATWLLHPNAPKVKMPQLITARIERMKKQR